MIATQARTGRARTGRACTGLVALLALAALAGCGRQDNADPAATPAETPGSASAVATTAALPTPSAPAAATRAEDVPQLASRDCAQVAQFALEAIGAHDFDRAAWAWNSATRMDAATLKAAFGSYATPQFTWAEPAVEGAAGSLYCTVTATLEDAGNGNRPPVDGTFTLRRVNDVEGATPEQLRWTVRSTTFVQTPTAG